MPRGGLRPSNPGGRPKGIHTKHKSTLDKEAAREVVRKFVTDNLEPMLRAQLAHAQGIGHLYTRDKSGKFNKIENMAVADKLLKEGSEGEDYWIFMKDPSVQAFTDLLNRALDKPKEQEQAVKVDGKLEITISKPW